MSSLVHSVFSPRARSTITGVECKVQYPSPRATNKGKFLTNLTNSADSSYTFETLTVLPTDLYLNHVHPLPSVTFPASALIPMARRSGMPAVVAAYDAGMTVAAVRS